MENTIDYDALNQRFDDRYSRLWAKGWRPMEKDRTRLKGGGWHNIVNHSELMWKPTEAFAQEIQAIFTAN